MGIVACCGKESQIQDLQNQRLLFTNTQSEKTNDGKENKLFYASNILKDDFEKIQLNFENSLKNQAEFISEKEFDEILIQKNEEIKKIDFPKEIENTEMCDSFKAPPIKFINGEIYKGSWSVNNKKNGFGINIYPDGLIYKGLWDGGTIGKYGLFLEENGNYYKGEIKHGKFNGKGEINIKDRYKYIGEFSSDMPDGKGYIEDVDKGFKYKGDMVKGKKEGKGILEYNDGTIYDGEFKNDAFNGEGRLKYKNGEYEGEFKEGKIKGKGKFTWEDGSIYVGEYDNFMKNGNGKFIWNKNKFYEGQWFNNHQHGTGFIYYNGKKLDGIFRFGKIIKERVNEQKKVI